MQPTDSNKESDSERIIRLAKYTRARAILALDREYNSDDADKRIIARAEHICHLLGIIDRSDRIIERNNYQPPQTNG